MNFERIGYLVFRATRWLTVFAVLALVWRRNAFINFGVYIPTLKPTDVLVPIALLGALAAWVLAPSIRNHIARNAFMRVWIGRLGMLLVFFAVGSLWAFVARGHSPTLLEAGQYIRIGIGMGAFLLVCFVGYGNTRYLRALSYALLGTVALVPLLFVPEERILSWFLVVSPSGYTFLGFQPSTLVMGSFLMPSILLFLSLWMTDRTRKKHIFWLVALLLTSLMLWTGARSAWFATFVGIVGMLWILWRQSRNHRELFLRIGAVLVLFLGALLLLRPLARNTALVRIFRHLDVPTHVSREILEKLASLPRLQGFEGIEYSLLRLPTRLFFEVARPSPGIEFVDGRGKIWAEYATAVLHNPLGVGPDYPTVFRDNPPSYLNGAVSIRRQAGAHSLWLQVALAGGIGGLLYFLLAVARVGKQAYTLSSKAKDHFALWLWGVFVGTAVMVSFVDALEFRWAWVVMALIVTAYENQLRGSGEERLLPVSETK